MSIAGIKPEVFPPSSISLEIRTEYTAQRCIANTDNPSLGPMVAVSPDKKVIAYQKNVSGDGVLFNPLLPRLTISFTMMKSNAIKGYATVNVSVLVDIRNSFPDGSKSLI